MLSIPEGLDEYALLVLRGMDDDVRPSDEAPFWTEPDCPQMTDEELCPFNPPDTEAA